MQAENNQNEEEDNFFNLLTRFQSKRMDDQRCSLTLQNASEVVADKKGVEPAESDKVSNGKHFSKRRNSLVMTKINSLLAFSFSASIWYKNEISKCYFSKI